MWLSFVLLKFTIVLEARDNVTVCHFCKCYTVSWINLMLLCVAITKHFTIRICIKKVTMSRIRSLVGVIACWNCLHVVEQMSWFMPSRIWTLNTSLRYLLYKDGLFLLGRGSSLGEGRVACHKDGVIVIEKHRRCGLAWWDKGKYDLQY